MPTPASRVVRELRHFGKLIGRTLLFVYVPLITGLVLLHYPYDTDASQRASKETAPSESTATFYEVAYSKTDKRKRGVDYEATAAEAAVASDIKGQVSRFVAKQQLQNKRILDVGSGRGYLQDIVADYTGLDLSPTVAPKYHKPFVVGSATKMPFPDNSFDAAWTVWVVEHIPRTREGVCRDAARRQAGRTFAPDRGLELSHMAGRRVRGASIRGFHPGGQTRESIHSA